MLIGWLYSTIFVIVSLNLLVPLGFDEVPQFQLTLHFFFWTTFGFCKISRELTEFFI